MTKSYDYMKNHSFAEQIEAYRFEFDTSKRRMEKELAKCTKLEDRVLKVFFGGYYKREDLLRGEWTKTMKDHERLTLETEVFRVLSSQEDKGLRSRLLEAKRAVQMQE